MGHNISGLVTDLTLIPVRDVPTVFVPAAFCASGMAEKKRRSCQDTPAVPPSDNGSEDTSVNAAFPSGAGSVSAACTFMPRFLLHHITFDHGLIDVLRPDQPRQEGNLLCRKDWIQ